MNDEMKTVAIYARVSSERQAEKDLSIPAQIKALKKYAIDRGWEVTAEYIDEAESARTANRPAFQEMIGVAKKKERLFDAILVWKLSRFARNREDSIIYKSLLRKRGISVISINEKVDESPAGHLLEGIIEVIDEFYSSNLAEDTIRGMKENVERGFYNGGHAPLGYKKVKVSVGGLEKTRLALEDKEVPIVQKIFNLANEKNGGKEIAKILNADGIRTRSGQLFTSDAINRILRNEVYTGVLAWKCKSPNFYSSGAVGSSGVIRSPVSHPEIISREEFESIQRNLRVRSPAAQNPRIVASQYLLSGVLRCGKCGSAMHGCRGKSGQFFYYECGNHHKKGKLGCDARLMRKDRIEQFVIDKVKNEILTENNISQLVQLTNEELNSNNVSSERQTSELNSQISQAEARLNKLYAALETGKIDIDGLAPRIKQIRFQIKELQDNRDELIEKTDNQSSDSLDSSEVNKYVADTKEILSSSTFTERKTFLASFIKRIELDEPVVAIDYRPSKRKLYNDLLRNELTNGLRVPSTKMLGSPTRARTSNLAVNSRALYH